MNGYIGKSEFQIQFPNTESVRIATPFISAGYDIIHAFAHQSFKGHFFSTVKPHTTVWKNAQSV